MGKKFSEVDLSKMPTEQEVSELVDLFEYRKLEVAQLPETIRQNGLTDKFNSVVLTASGSTSGNYYTFNGIRPDKGDLDEEPFVFYFDHEDEQMNFGGIIHHGDWPGRTEPMTQEQQAAIEASGLTANFIYKGVPPGGSGSLEDLNEKGMLKGVSKQFQVLIRKMKDKAR